MEICALSLQDLEELQLSHLWHFNVRMTSAASEGNVQRGEKLRFVILTFWTSSDCNKLQLDELECVIKTEVGEQKSWGEEPAVLTPSIGTGLGPSRPGRSDQLHFPTGQRRPESETTAGGLRKR